MLDSRLVLGLDTRRRLACSIRMRRLLRSGSAAGVGGLVFVFFLCDGGFLGRLTCSASVAQQGYLAVAS
jgi:hypothetical protein